MPVPEIQPEELKRKLDARENVYVLDVRDPDEYAQSNLGGNLIPLAELPKRLGELDPGQEIVCHCKMGGRGGKATELLMQNGFKNVKNLAGGLFAWSERIDSNVKKY